MLTVLFFQWCEARFIGEGIPCPATSSTSKGRAVVLRLGDKNTIPEIASFGDDGSGNLVATVEEEKD